MQEATATVNLPGKAPLANVGLTLGALNGAINRPSHLPGIVVLYGPSGLGKSTSATIATVQLRAYYVQAKSSWTRKAVYQSILKSMGVDPAKTIYEMEEQVTAQLAASRRPLIVDECDHLVAKGIIEVVRDIYEGSGAAILLIGEEHLPSNLARWERIHNRVLEWVPAQYADLDDARALRDLYCAKVTVGDDLLEHIHAQSKGVARRICVNLERVQQAGLELGKKSMDLTVWGKRPLYTGEAPVREGRYPTMGSAAVSGSIQDVLRRGYITVKLIQGTAAKGSQVYVRHTAETGKAVGDIEAAAVEGKTLAVPGCIFMGEADGNGNVEISYNL